MKKPKYFETYLEDEYGNALGYDTNKPIFAYKNMFLIISEDLQKIESVLMDYQDSLTSINKELLNLKKLQRQYKLSKTSGIFLNDFRKNEEIKKIKVRSFSKELEQLHPETKPGAVFMDAYGVNIGIFTVEEDRVTIIAGFENLTFRKGWYGMLQKLTSHEYIGMSEFYQRTLGLELGKSPKRYSNQENNTQDSIEVSLKIVEKENSI
ncbi:hypothetical protein GW932_02745 [archaeon]|nr:hypothetical protein [archaeon]